MEFETIRQIGDLSNEMQKSNNEEDVELLDQHVIDVMNKVMVDYEPVLHSYVKKLKKMQRGITVPADEFQKNEQEVERLQAEIAAEITAINQLYAKYHPGKILWKFDDDFGAVKIAYEICKDHDDFNKMIFGTGEPSQEDIEKAIDFVKREYGDQLN